MHPHRKDGALSGKQQHTMYMSVILFHGKLRQDFKVEASLGYMLNQKPPAWKEKGRKEKGEGREGIGKREERGRRKQKGEVEGGTEGRKEKGGKEEEKGKREEREEKGREKKDRKGRKEGYRDKESARY